MDELFSIDVYSSILAEDYVNSTSFKQFCEDVDQLDNLFNDYIDDMLYTEVVKDNRIGVKKRAGKVLKNTSDTISNTTSIYGRTTDVLGRGMKGLWDLCFNAINLISKVILWFLDKINSIPEAIGKMIKSIGEIPERIKSMIRGDIILHITINDIDMVYNKSILHKITNFLDLMKVFRDGETWSTFFRRRFSVKTKDTKKGEKIDIVGTLKHPIDNDMQIGRKMKALYEDIKKIDLEETRIDMSDKKNISKYLSNDKSVKFTDLYGKLHHCSYFEALKQLAHDLDAKKDIMKEVQKDIGDKFTSSEGKQQFARMSQLQQQRITESIEMVSKCVSLVGKITKSVMQDMNTINKAIKKCLKNDKLKKSSDPRKPEAV